MELMFGADLVVRDKVYFTLVYSYIFSCSDIGPSTAPRGGGAIGLHPVCLSVCPSVCL